MGVGFCLAFVTAFAASHAAAECEPDHVWFLGGVYDGNGNPPSESFQHNLATLEFLLATLRGVYCIPDSQAQILAFRGDAHSRGYPPATEANIYTTLDQFGEAASPFDDSILFYFQSSHGIIYAAHGDQGLACLVRGAGSLAAVGDGNGQDGDIYDCELGNRLNEAFAPSTRMVIYVHCSLCGGFSDSLTAVSGTVPDQPISAGVVGPGRIVMTGCTMTTECFGNSGFGSYGWAFFRHAIERGADTDGWTAPQFPTVQGLNVAIRGAEDGRITVSEAFWSSVNEAQTSVIGLEHQFRLKYGFASLAEDIEIARP